MKRRPIVVEFDETSHDTVACLESLLKLARERRLVGMVMVGFMPRRQYFVQTTGTAHGDPTHALGAAHVLCDGLSARVRGVTD